MVFFPSLTDFFVAFLLVILFNLIKCFSLYFSMKLVLFKLTLKVFCLLCPFLFISLLFDWVLITVFGFDILDIIFFCFNNKLF